MRSAVRHVVLSLTASLLALVIAGCQPQPPQDASSEDRMLQLGERVYRTYCATCHQADGRGVPGAFPPLRQTDWVEGDKGRLIRLVLNGLQGRVVVQGEVYEGVMTPHNFLTDDQIAAVLTYVRQHFGNTASAVSPDAVTAVRTANERDGLWTPGALQEATGIPGADSASTVPMAPPSE